MNTLYKYLIKPCRGTIFLLLYLVNILFFAILIYALAIITYIVPWKPWRKFGTRLLHQMPIPWTVVNKAITSLNSIGKWDVQKSTHLNPNGWYMVIANHVSAIDILVLYHFFNRKIPVLKFFMKKELLWTLPLGGLACYITGYPFMQRYTREDIRKNPALKGKDIETAKKACQRFKSEPTALINFPEGTRCTAAKQRRQNSPFQHLLKPKAGGTAVVINEWRQNLTGIIDVTIAYKPHRLKFWDFLCGDFQKIILRYDVIQLTDEKLFGDYFVDREYRSRFQQWMNNRWTEKDKLISELVHD
jgi:1-acyl-sn-glycerol-3-phosphate acyltransferase